uniref:DUF148 domain-containing protein n=1 Tax=Caenorhabditis tropicalis TaxID=1561998 RepID=A0A1I7UNJ6_9PELO
MYSSKVAFAFIASIAVASALPNLGGIIGGNNGNEGGIGGTVGGVTGGLTGGEGGLGGLLEGILGGQGGIGGILEGVLGGEGGLGGLLELVNQPALQNILTPLLTQVFDLILVCNNRKHPLITFGN